MQAQHNLGAMYEKGGVGVQRDDSAAVLLFTAAAASGLTESCYSLAMHYKFGLGASHSFSTSTATSHT
jgi:uncharacterized protein